MTERMIKLSAGEVYVVDEGPQDAPAVIMVHGLPSSSTDFVHIGPVFGENMRRIRFDLPGMGKSPMSDWLYRPLHLAAELILELADALGLNRFWICAHSFGGALSLLAAAKLGERALGLVLINSAPTKHYRGMLMPKQGFTLMRRALDWPLTHGHVVKLTLMVYRKLGFKWALNSHVDTMRAHLLWLEKLDFHRMRQAAATLACPVLQISNNDDPLIEVSASTFLFRSLSHKIAKHHLQLSTGGHRLGRAKTAVLAPYLREMVLRYT